LQHIAFTPRNFLKYRKEFHYYAYIVVLSLMGICLPLSKYLVSVSIFLLIVNWITEWDFRNKFSRIYHRKSILILLSILLIYLAGMLYTENHEEGFKRILSFMPVPALTIILGTLKPISKKELKFILIAFVGAVCVSSLISVCNFFGWFTEKTITDIREISVFIPHLYLSLMVNIAIVILLYLVFFDYFNNATREKIVFLVMLSWLVFFVFFLRSFLGITIFVIVFSLFLAVLIAKLRSRIMKYMIFSFLVILLISIVFLVIYSFMRFYKVDSGELRNLETNTVNGNSYTHYPGSEQIENGHYVWVYICEKELQKEWNQMSRYPYQGLDQKGQQINHTLIRYLTSKGLRKDSTGLHQLTAGDILLVENGFTNYIFRNKYGIYQRMYQIIWELDMYSKTGEVHSHSVTQRIVFSKHALKLFKKNMLIGVGTGDIKASMLLQNQLDNTKIQKEWEGKPHNQFLNFAASFGMIGFCWILVAFIYPIFLERKQRVLLLNLILIIYLISMLSIDTLDSHVGVSLFAFFYVLLIYFWRTENQPV
jgi:hypothetical protein